MLIINGGLFALTFILEKFLNINLVEYLALFYFKSDFFKPYQFITHMFMHGNLWHLLFNMYALYLFGSILESNNVWGSKKFLIYYFVTGFGASLLHFFVISIRIHMISKNIAPEIVSMVFENSPALLKMKFNPADLEQIQKLFNLVNVPTIGASGAVFGLLLAFGMLFPNTPLYLMFIPIPIKAKYLVIGYGTLELVLGIMNMQGDNIAHFAHLGGLLFGFILIKIWGKGSDVQRWN